MLSFVVYALACDATVNDDPGESGEGEGEGEGDPAPIERNVCFSDGDCADGAVCSNIFVGDVRDHCTITCEVDDDCDVGDGFSYECIERDDGQLICARTCDAPDQCGDHGVCVTTDIVTDGVCFGFPGEQCNGDAQCLADEACVYVVGDVEWVSFCGPRDVVGELRTGDACDPSAADPPTAQDCAVGFCDPHGRCSGPCATDADCPDATFSCQAFPVPTQQGLDIIGFCAVGTNAGAVCDRNADCAAGEVCAFAPRVDGFQQAICREPLDGEALVGERCADDAATPELEPVRACQSGICAGGVCSATCLDDTDCSGLVCNREQEGPAGGLVGFCQAP